MTDLELIFTMLGEASTSEIIKNNESKGFKKIQKDGIEGGKIAGNARKELEQKTKKKIVSRQNYLDEDKKIK